jgi:uncharacterized protein YmfQ (DUF2313 family)
MPHIVLTDEQAAVYNGADGPIEIRFPDGKVVATILPEHSAAFIAELKRRAASPGPWYTGAQVQARLKALEEEWGRTGGFDQAYLREFLKKLNDADPGHMRPSN